ncbi:MAG: peptide-methionine (S)-S-oxide reductase MsrA [Candidatus Peribacteraceae bacterium]
MKSTSQNHEIALLGAGCFWGVEESFRTLPGVHSTAVGYAGGHTDSPTYDDVCSDATGHAEVVRVEFDPTRITYPEILKNFFTFHNPTQKNRQGPDVGSQYRSVIFFFSPEQEKSAHDEIDRQRQSGVWSQPIATVVEPAPTFYAAEDYHQKYLMKQGRSSCHL